MGRPNFGRPAAHPTPPIVHALHDDDVDVVDGDVVVGVHNELPAKATAEPELAFPLGCRWRVPLTRMHNPSSVLLLYRDQLDAQTLDHVIEYVNVDGSIVI